MAAAVAAGTAPRPVERRAQSEARERAAVSGPSRHSVARWGSPVGELVARMKKCSAEESLPALSIAARARSQVLEPRQSRSVAHIGRPDCWPVESLASRSHSPYTTPLATAVTAERCALIILRANMIWAVKPPAWPRTNSLAPSSHCRLRLITMRGERLGAGWAAVRRARRSAFFAAVQETSMRKCMLTASHLSLVASAPRAAWPAALPLGGSMPLRRYFSMCLRRAASWRVSM
mmetsp:Transcript_61305/g.168315  ORF Transcript_61305/g.168315 Transcript_61305/m.168315 type:complete len:234 (-) Transcript_61305:905-1606(-)